MLLPIFTSALTVSAGRFSFTIFSPIRRIEYNPATHGFRRRTKKTPESGTDGQGPNASVTFIDVLFAVVMSLGLPQVMAQPWFKSASWSAAPTIVFEVLVILLGYLTLLLSWWGYHRSLYRRGIYESTWTGKSLFTVDILILVGYWLLLVRFENFLFVLCVLATVYVLYICWNCLRSRQDSETCPKQWRRRGVTILWTLVLLVILGIYGVLRLNGFLSTPVDWAFVILAHMVNFLYRWHKGHLSPGWLLDLLTPRRRHKEVCG